MARLGVRNGDGTRTVSVKLSLLSLIGRDSRGTLLSLLRDAPTAHDLIK